MKNRTSVRDRLLTGGLCLLSVAAAPPLHFAMISSADSQFPLVAYYGAVAFCAWRGGLSWGITSLALCLVAVDFFILSPGSILAFSKPRPLAAFGFVSLLLILLAEKSRRAQQRALSHAVDLEKQRDQAALAIASGQKSDARLRLALEAVHMATWEWRKDTQTIDADPEFLRMWGLPPAPHQIPVDSLLRAVSSEDLEALRDAGRKTLLGQPFDVEFRITRPSDQSAAWIGAKGRLLPDSAEVRSKTAGASISGVAFDITPRKLIEMRLQDQQQRLQLLADAIPALIAYVDDNQCYQFNNLAYEKWFGRPLNLVKGRTLGEVLGAEAYATIKPHVEAALRGDPVTYEAWVNYEGAGRRCILASYVPQKDQGKVLGFYVFVQDITERKASEDAVRESEEKFRGIIETANEGIWMLNKEGQIIMVNPRLCELIGFRPEELLGNYKWGFVFPESVPQAKQLFERRRSGLAEQVDFRFRHKDGTEIWTLMAARPLYNAEGEFTGVLDMFSDITLRKRAEEALNQAKNELVRVNEDLEKRVAERTLQLQETIAQLEEFSYSVSHDMRAPLRAMQGFSEALLEEHSDKLDSEAQDLLQRIRKASRRLDLLIQDVLSYSKIAKTDVVLRPLDLESVLREIVEQYPSFQPPKARISLQTPFPQILAHEAFLSQVVSNLLGNATKFVSRGVTPEISIWADLLDDMVRINIKDNGIGIAPLHEKRIFEIFGRVHSEKEFEGTGIGLAIVKKALERMGGAVGVESKLGEGSRFWFTLKRVP